MFMEKKLSLTSGQLNWVYLFSFLHFFYTFSLYFKETVKNLNHELDSIYQIFTLKRFTRVEEKSEEYAR